MDVTVMGGCGHVGLPLGLALAQAGLKVALYDVDLGAVDRVGSGKMPHLEPGAPEVLARVLANGNLSVSADASTVATAEHVIVVLGTPIDEHFNPDPQALVHSLERVADELHDGQLLILRSTVFPGVTRMVERLMHRLGKAVDVAFCPERIAEGRAMEELSRAAPDRLGPHQPVVRPGGGPLPPSDRQDRPGRARRGGAGQAVHQLLSLHQVRGRQPVVHDGE